MSNIVQLIPVVACALWFPHYVLGVALASYGLSYFVTFFLLEAMKPARAKLPLGGWNRGELGTGLRFAAPLIVSCGAHQALFGIDLI